MERLIDEFLAFSRGDALDDLETVDPIEFMQAVVGKFHAEKTPIKLIVPDVAKPVMLRPVAVTRALENLIGNALKYGARCQVVLMDSDQMLRFIVEDDGPGIAAEARDDAMKPFVRLDAARNQDRGGGVGLGLAIAHDIARRHGGALQLGTSEDLGGLRAELTVAR